MAPTVLALDVGTNDVITGTMLGATIFAIGIGARWVVTVVVLGAIILNHLPPPSHCPSYGNDPPLPNDRAQGG